MDKHYITLYFNGYMLSENINPKGLGSEEKDFINMLVEKYNVKKSDIKRGYNFKNIIPYTLLSNILVTLCGGVPIPTNPARKERVAKFLKRTPIYDVFDEIAKNSYYHVDSVTDSERFIEQVCDKNGNVYTIIKDGFQALNGSEFMQSSKLKINSNRIVNTILFKNDPSKTLTVHGEYNWKMLLRLFDYNTNNKDYKEIINILSTIYGDDVTNLKFVEMCEYFHDHKNDQKVQETIDKYLPAIKAIWKNNSLPYIDKWLYAIFAIGENSSSSNTSSTNVFFPKSFLRINRGIDHRKSNITGHIIVEIDDERILNALHDNIGFCRFMEGGICQIVDVTNYTPNFNYKEEWTKISDEKPFKNYENQ